MFDCLDTSPFSATGLVIAESTQRPIDPQQLARRHSGRNWLHFSARPGRQAQLARARAAALYLDAEVECLADGSLLLLGLSLTEILALSERFNADLASQANIASQASRT